jgi:hypothetical protein
MYSKYIMKVLKKKKEITCRHKGKRNQGHPRCGDIDAAKRISAYVM